MKGDKIPLKAVKIGILGDTCVGKLSICKAYLGYDFNENSLNNNISHGKFETKFILDNGKEIRLIIWSAPGQERFHSIALNTMKSVNGILLIADLTRKESFDNIKKWLRDIEDNLNNPYIVLFGNKADLKDQWEITSEEAKKYAEENKLIYFETSAKTKQGIKEGFSYIANQAYKIVEQKLNKNIIIGKDKRKKIKSKRSSSK